MRRLSGRVAAGALVVGLVGCGGATDRQGDPAEVSERVRDELQETYEATWGDPRTRRAVEVLAYVAHEERLADCLAGRGAGHVPGPFLDTVAREPGPLSWYDALLPVDGRGDRLVPLDPVDAEVVPARRWPGRPATADDLGACVGAPPEVPALAPALDAELYELVTDALGGTGAIDGYAQCLADRGFRAESRDDLVDALLAERTPEGRPGPRERDAVVADAACRADAHHAAMQALDEPLRRFRERHADELARLPERAERLQQDAASEARRFGLPVAWW